MAKFGTFSTALLLTLQTVLPSVLTAPPQSYSRSVEASPVSHPIVLKLETYLQNENPTSFGNRTFAELLRTTDGGHSERDVMEFIGLVKKASEAIQREVETIDEGISGDAKKVLNSSVVMLKETTFQVMLLADHITKKIELNENERAIRMLADKLFGAKNRTSYYFWLTHNVNLIMEDILHLKMHFTELSTLYQALMIGVIKLNPTLLVDAKDRPLNKNNCLIKSSTFLCDNGSRSVDCVNYCNGVNDCGDYSDEPIGCNNPFKITPTLFPEDTW